MAIPFKDFRLGITDGIAVYARRLFANGAQTELPGFETGDNGSDGKGGNELTRRAAP